MGYEISLNRCFYRPQPLRPLDRICTVEAETERLLEQVLVEMAPAFNKGAE